MSQNEKGLLLGVAKAKDSVTLEVTHFQIHFMAPRNPMTPTDHLLFALKNKLAATGGTKKFNS